MTAVAAGPVGLPAGHYRLRHVLRMEWIKLRGLRSTWSVLALVVAGAIGIGLAVGVNTRNAAGDLTNNALGGIAPGLLLIGVLGVLATTGEYASGTIRATLAAIPNRPLLLVAKASVLGAVALAAGEAAAFVAFFAGTTTLPARIPAPTLGQPGVLRAVVLGGAGYCLIGLIGLGLGAIVRHTAAALAVLVGGVYVVGQIAGAVANSMMAYLPISIVANSLSVTRPVEGAHFLSPWTGLGMLCLYTVVVLSAGGWLLARRDA
ncbi:MAG TPA: ABC transporter permease [Actinomycetota bacterium]|nr:ABC transporter permease [Actinomycetota bacterium]